MAVPKWSLGCFGTYFEAKFKAYVELQWYFAVLFTVYLTLGIWAFVVFDPDPVAAVKPRAVMETCMLINKFVEIYGICAFVEAFISLLLALGIGSIMQSKSCATLGLASLIGMLLLLLIKTVVITLGIMWVFGQEAGLCAAKLPSYMHAVKPLILGALVVYGLQLLFGTAFLFCCGVDTAIKDARNQCSIDGDRESLLHDDDRHSRAQDGR